MNNLPSIDTIVQRFALVCVSIATALVILFKDSFAIDAAVAVALVTLVAVLYQIILARDQLKLATEELKAVKDDFRLSQQMFETNSRCAKVSLIGFTVELPGQIIDQSRPYPTRLFFTVRNGGKLA